MKIYLVGGAVRDKLLGLPVKEKDWVVVGATVQQMLNLGFRQVGKDFPVFLHPKTQEEYALARVERKIQLGYKGFTFDTSLNVSLENDLQRRDLTINAMAETMDGELIDPYGGHVDLKNKILRHVSPAFAEDPVRILRVGRFLARYHHLGFHVAPETMMLMRKMVEAGEVDALVAERVWKEFDRALTEKNPEKFFEVLAECGALTKLFPSLSLQSQGMKALQAAAQISPVSKIRFAALLHDTPYPKKNIADLCHRYRAPQSYHNLALLTAAHYQTALQAQQLSVKQISKLLYALDIFRREERFNHFLTACTAIAQIQENAASFHPDWLLHCARAAKSFDVKELLEQGLTGLQLARELEKKRQDQIQLFVESQKPSR